MRCFGAKPVSRATGGGPWASVERTLSEAAREDTERNLVVLTSAQGASRVYDAEDVRWARQLDDALVVDELDRAWRITEEALVLDDDPSDRRLRVPAQRAFWFGWYAQFPDTELIH